jgi:hypothetical protein
MTPERLAEIRDLVTQDPFHWQGARGFESGDTYRSDVVQEALQDLLAEVDGAWLKEILRRYTGGSRGHGNDATRR